MASFNKQSTMGIHKANDENNISNCFGIKYYSKEELIRSNSQKTEKSKENLSSEDEVNIMISSYMRSGSSFLGRVIGFRKDVFYYFEPLWGFRAKAYMAENDKLCDTFRPACRSSESINVSLKMLDQVYSCRLSQPPLASYFTPNQVQHSGFRWESQCKGRGQPASACLKLMEDVCAESPFKVTKVLRISLAHAEELFQRIPNLKIVHLFRDPRATINSHSNTGWSPIRVTNKKHFAAGAQAVCDRIVKDVKYGEALLKMFPDRFKIVQYEDFGNSVPVIKTLYKFLGMPFDYEVLKYVDKNDNQSSQTMYGKGNHPDTYRQTLNWDTNQVINRYCKRAMELLGYRLFTNTNDYKNMSVSAIKDLTYKLDS